MEAHGVPASYEAEVVIVGAGPGGATAAYHLAQAGVDVVVLEKSTFPREKVCGDGLTPRAVKQLTAMGIETLSADGTARDGWIKNHGLRIIGGGMRIEVPWPDLASFPSYGLVRPRQDFDEILARAAQKSGARLYEGETVTAPLIDEVTGRVQGVTTRDGMTVRAPITLVADGNSSRLSLALGIRKRDDRPMGVAYRKYFRSPRHDDDWLESWLELWDGTPGQSRLLPGYGWIFGVGDGTSNVGLGILNTSDAFGKTDYRAMLDRWLSHLPPEWGFVEDNSTGPTRGAALPMAFNRKPHYANGALLVGDAGGMVNPMNGEGIAYAMEAGKLAAEVVAQALAETDERRQERVLESYPAALAAEYGGYFTIGRLFVKAIGHPSVMKLCTRHGLPHPTLMRFCLKLLANLSDARDGDAMDRIITTLNRLAPAA
ncbi:MAG TPA: geranylgeranyl reductase family protein [Mycobacteriales bacterium]|jgi:geranylgeranyl reductase family protein|nr:geranylgeranyl reductase family protein [Mycobacteriales bacterium]